MIEIPYHSLEEHTLIALIESFVLRDGTDYGAVELSLEKKVENIKLQLASKKLCILFEESDETCTIVNSDVLEKLKTQLA